jgi:hypothetical protein
MRSIKTIRLATLLLLLFIQTSQLFGQVQEISSNRVSGIYIYDNQLWYIDDGNTKIYDLSTDKDITVKYKVYSRIFTPIASSGSEIWIMNSNNIFVLSKIKTKRYNLPNKLYGLENGTIETYNNFIPIGINELLIRGLSNRAKSNEAARIVKVDAVYADGKVNEIIDYLPTGSAVDFVDVAFRPESEMYVTDSWSIQKKTNKGFTPIDLSKIKGAQSISLGEVAADGSLWVYQAGEGLIHVEKNKATRIDYGRNARFLKGEKVNHLQVLENGLVAIATESEIWLMMRNYFYPLKTDFNSNKIRLMKSWENKLIVATDEGLIVMDAK